MTRADRLMTDWLNEVEQSNPTDADRELARDRMRNTLAYQSAVFVDSLENAAMTILRSLRIVR